MSRIILPNSFDDLPPNIAGEGNATPRDPRNIELATRERNHIDNYQCRDSLTNLNLRELEETERRWVGQFKKRAAASALYNCHGLSFGSRRTQITSSEQVWTIIKEDGYLEVERNDVLPGDVILYVGDDQDVAHSGIVIGLPDPNCSYDHLLILSKWGIGGEYIHKAYACDYDETQHRYFRSANRGTN